MPRANSIIERLPHFYRSGEEYNLLYHFVGVFGALLDGAEEDLIRVMRAHYVDTADNEGSEGFDAFQKGDLDRIFALYLESLGGTNLLKQINRRAGEEGKLDDVVYRTRIKGLIEVLRTAASTREGIIRIVGANLGIVDDTAVARAARNKIQIKEFLEREHLLGTFSLPPHQPFTVVNPNVTPTKPTIRIRFPNQEPVVRYRRPGIVNLTSGQSAFYEGEVESGDELAFFHDGSARLNGEIISTTAPTPVLPMESSEWQLELELGVANEAAPFYPIGLFDQRDFDGSVFALDVVADLSMYVLRGTPATFMVQVPWDLPGYTVNFKLTQRTLDDLLASGIAAEQLVLLEPMLDQEISTITELRQKIQELFGQTPTEDLLVSILDRVSYSTDKFANLLINPRTQINGIVNKVKAAGVYAAVAYEKRFKEFHDMLTARITKIIVPVDQELTESKFDIISDQTNRLDQELEDNFISVGAFDLTYYDSQNRFA